ncbi:MAG: hypothetical protein ACRDJC_07730 [Thermomicrobiales bacterium]
MTARYAVLASRIRQDVAELERVGERVERAAQAYRQNTAERELFLDAAALNLHDYYTGLERIFTHIASGVEQSVPTGPDWHRELLRQMTVEVPGLRPPVIPTKVASDVDEFLRFRHVVRHIYAFALEPERVERLASRLRPAHHAVASALLAFASFLEGLASDAESAHAER